ncbi:hypothetical protein CRT60_21980 [Azospirillum palustre]|uniref:HNH nuclease domain-containing protein n=1 Tax=Azospirillum palustre TaxID=2044885 RepID=A0A2B8BEW3_9PROT|nr:HNH endonuclease [Azospirillum palustre]PGH55922.1 hypothetical protein CRT60_21980 [Azospirillum palustre]
MEPPSPITLDAEKRAKRKRSKRIRQIKKIVERDGDACFFCGRSLGDDITIEHLVPITHGGPDHRSNLVLAHHACNQRADHLSVAEKVRLREEMHRQPEEFAV